MRRSWATARSLDDAPPSSDVRARVHAFAQNAMCGPIGDGCGGQLDCGSCTSPETCGGDGTPFACGGGTGSGACIAADVRWRGRGLRQDRRRLRRADRELRDVPDRRGLRRERRRERVRRRGVHRVVRATERVHEPAAHDDHRHGHDAGSRRHRDVGHARSDLRRARLRAERQRRSAALRRHRVRAGRRVRFVRVARLGHAAGQPEHRGSTANSHSRTCPAAPAINLPIVIQLGRWRRQIVMPRRGLLRGGRWL